MRIKALIHFCNNNFKFNETSFLISNIFMRFLIKNLCILLNTPLTEWLVASSHNSESRSQLMRFLNIWAKIRWSQKSRSNYITFKVNSYNIAPHTHTHTPGKQLITLLTSCFSEYQPFARQCLLVGCTYLLYHIHHATAVCLFPSRWMNSMMNVTIE